MLDRGRFFGYNKKANSKNGGADVDEPRKFYVTSVKTDSSDGEISANMAKDSAFLRLWDIYNPLLTAHQREITDLYFNYDLSLGEIAEEKGVSRQSVSDCLNKCRAQLRIYEEKLGIAEALETLSSDLSRRLEAVRAWIEAQRLGHPEWAEELDCLQAAVGIEIEE